MKEGETCPIDLVKRMSDWQPIETAPKDRRIILWADGQGWLGKWQPDRRAIYRSGCWVFKRPRPYWKFETKLGVRYQRENQPTHWMSLPEPPYE